jgi:hypothetical protein
MKHVTRNQDDVGLEIDDLIYRTPECMGDVGLTLIESARRETLKLAKAKMQIR